MGDLTKDELGSCEVSSGMLYLLGVAGNGVACEISGLRVVDVTGVELPVVMASDMLGSGVVGVVVIVDAGSQGSSFFCVCTGVAGSAVSGFCVGFMAGTGICDGAGAVVAEGGPVSIGKTASV